MLLLLPTQIYTGYGFEHLPSTPGPHILQVHLWRPAGDNEQELDAYLLGRTPALVRYVNFKGLYLYTMSTIFNAGWFTWKV